MIKMIEKNRNIYEFFYQYIQKHSYFRVKSISNQFKESLGLIPELSYLSEKEYNLSNKPIGKIIGNIIRVLILNGFMKQKSTTGSCAHKITKLMILGMKQLLNESKIQNKRITNPMSIKIKNRIFVLKITSFQWNFFLNCYYPSATCKLEYIKINRIFYSLKQLVGEINE